MVMSALDAGTKVSVAYANMAKANKIRAWAKRNNASVKLSRYATDAYEGYVYIPSTWNEGRESHLAKVAEFRSFLKSL